MLIKIVVALALFAVSLPSYSLVRYNPITGHWEGNICVNNLGWAIVAFQPIGSLCRFVVNNRLQQGIIINQ